MKFILAQLTTLTIHNSLTVSFPAPTSSTNLSHHRLSSSLRTDFTDFMTGPVLLSILVFCFSFLHYSCFLVLCGRLKLAIHQLLGTHKYSYSTAFAAAAAPTSNTNTFSFWYYFLELSWVRPCPLKASPNGNLQRCYIKTLYRPFFCHLTTVTKH